jgi:peptide/nickel transport system substrate-binding protein
MCWEPLIGLDDRLNPTPVLAESWTLSDDGLTWTFALRKGVTFSDGEPFNAAAVVANINRNIQISPRTSNFFTMNAPLAYGELAEVVADGEHTVIFRHKQPFPVMEATMSNFFSAMFSPKSFTAEGNFSGIPGTTGPFTLVEWQRDQSYRLVRNERYWGTAAKVREIVFQQIADANTRVAALESGQVEGLVELGALGLPQAAALRERQDLTVAAGPITLAQWLHFHCGRAPFDDRRLRQAVVFAIDRELIVKEFAFGFGNAATGILSTLSERWFSPKGIVTYDPERAKALAAEALQNQRREIILPFDPNNARIPRELPEYLQSVLAPLGLDIKLQAVEAAVLTDVVRTGEWNLRLTNGFGWANGDPDFRFRPHLHSKGSANTTQQGGYRNEAVDTLIDNGVLQRDQRERFAICEQIQAIAAEDVPAIVLYDVISPYAFRNTIANLGLRITYQPTLELMTKQA